MQKYLKSPSKIYAKHLKRNGLAIGLIVTAILAFLFYLTILKDLPLPTKLSSSSTPQSTLIYDRNGKLLYNIYDKKNQSFIPLSKHPPDDAGGNHRDRGQEFLYPRGG